jgi:hypothetical protein
MPRTEFWNNPAPYFKFSVRNLNKGVCYFESIPPQQRVSLFLERIPIYLQILLSTIYNSSSAYFSPISNLLKLCFNCDSVTLHCNIVAMQQFNYLCYSFGQTWKTSSVQFWFKLYFFLLPSANQQPVRKLIYTADMYVNVNPSFLQKVETCAPIHHVNKQTTKSFIYLFPTQ